MLHARRQVLVRPLPFPLPPLPTLNKLQLTSPSGEPTGKLIKIAGKYDGYLATPAEGKAHAGAGLLYLPDVISIWQNSKLMADQFAANGYLCLVVDLFNGDALSLGERPPDFDFMGWMTKGSDGKNPHTPEAVDPIVEAAAKTLREEYGVSKMGAVGYCFGAKVRYPFPSPPIPRLPSTSTYPPQEAHPSRTTAVY